MTSKIAVKFAVQDKVIDEASFNTEYWPKIENAINVMLHKNPGESFQFSYEDVFSVAYKCTTQRFSEQMLLRVTTIIDKFTSCCLANISSLSGQEYLERFKFFLKQFFQAAEGIAAIFSYMDRNYVVRTFGKNMLSMMYWQLSEKIVIQSTVFDNLRQISEGDFEVDPQLLMSIIQGLYTLRKDFASFNMKLFKRFIPNIESASNIDCLPAMDDEVLAREIDENKTVERMAYKRKADEVMEDTQANLKRFAKAS
ncbi:CDK2-associated and cullin domain-containing protein 1-like isoform X2 [Rhopilema esculentum]|uniref:CDK2-associated and cullin domain-containing protein 1-like isoform X2 n=1 Tax=Rhopilema esculentum TaxID=499914 RepID=UPI0031D9106F